VTAARKWLTHTLLAQVAEAKAATKGGVLLPESAKEKPVVGEVLATGPGKEKEDMKLLAGDKVVYFKYGGDKMMDDKGAEYGAPSSTSCTHCAGLTSCPFRSRPAPERHPRQVVIGVGELR